METETQAMLFRGVKPLIWIEKTVLGGDTKTVTEDGNYWVCEASPGWMIIGHDDTGHISRLSKNVDLPTKEKAQEEVQRIHIKRIMSYIDVDHIEVTHDMVRAASESRAVDDEGEYLSLHDLLDFSGENKCRIVIRAALHAALEKMKGWTK